MAKLWNPSTGQYEEDEQKYWNPATNSYQSSDMYEATPIKTKVQKNQIKYSYNSNLKPMEDELNANKKRYEQESKTYNASKFMEGKTFKTTDTFGAGLPGLPSKTKIVEKSDFMQQYENLQDRHKAYDVKVNDNGKITLSDFQAKELASIYKSGTSEMVYADIYSKNYDDKTIKKLENEMDYEASQSAAQIMSNIKTGKLWTSEHGILWDALEGELNKEGLVNNQYWRDKIEAQAKQYQIDNVSTADKQAMKVIATADAVVGGTYRGYYNTKIATKVSDLISVGKFDEANEYIKKNPLKYNIYKGLKEEGIEVKQSGVDSALEGAFNLMGQMGSQVNNPFTAVVTAGGAVGGALLTKTPQGAAAGAKAGITLGNTKGAYSAESGFAYMEMLDAGVDAETAKNLAMGVGVVNAGLEFVQIGKLLKIANKTTNSTVKQVIKNYVFNVVENAIQETGQEAVTVTALNLGKDASGLKTDDVNTIVDRLTGTFTSSLITFGLFNAPSSMVSIANAKPNAVKNTQGQLVLKPVEITQYNNEAKTMINAAKTQGELDATSVILDKSIANIEMTTEQKNNIKQMIIDKEKTLQTIPATKEVVKPTKKINKNATNQLQEIDTKINNTIDKLTEMKSVDKIDIEGIYNELNTLRKQRDEINSQLNEYQKIDKITKLQKEIDEIKKIPEDKVTVIDEDNNIDKIKQVEKMTTQVEKSKPIKVLSNKQQILENRTTLINDAQSILDQLNIVNQDKNKPVQIVTELNAEQRQIEDLGAIFGKQVIFTDGLNSSGMSIPNNDKLIFIDKNAKNSLITTKGENGTMLYVMGHELFHSLKQTYPDIYTQFVDYIKTEIDTKQIVEFMKKYDSKDTQGLLKALKIEGKYDLQAIKDNPTEYLTQNEALNNISEEMVSHEFGRMMLDKEYLTKLKESNPSLFKQVVESIKKLLKSLEGSVYDSELTELQVETIRNDFEKTITELETELKKDNKVEIKKPTDDEIAMSYAKREVAAINKEREEKAKPVEKEVSVPTEYGQPLVIVKDTAPKIKNLMDVKTKTTIADEQGNAITFNRFQPDAKSISDKYDYSTSKSSHKTGYGAAFTNDDTYTKDKGKDDIIETTIQTTKGMLQNDGQKIGRKRIERLNAIANKYMKNDELTEYFGIDPMRSDKLIDAINQMADTIAGETDNATARRAWVDFYDAIGKDGYVKTERNGSLLAVIVNPNQTEYFNKLKKPAKTVSLPNKINNEEKFVDNTAKVTKVDVESRYAFIEKTMNRQSIEKNINNKKELLDSAMRAYQNYKKDGGTQINTELDILIKNKVVSEMKSKLGMKQLPMNEITSYSEITNYIDLQKYREIERNKYWQFKNKMKNKYDVEGKINIDHYNDRFAALTKDEFKIVQKGDEENFLYHKMYNKFVRETIQNKYNDKQKANKNQNEFFKESKIRDKNGDLLQVFHGTHFSFDTFDKKQIGKRFNADNEGFFFTNDNETAFEYAENIAIDTKYNFGEGRVIATYLNITNPLVKKIKSQYMSDTYGNAITYFDANKTKWIKEAKKNGNDGLMILDDYDTMEMYIAFEANQIKYVDNKKPTLSTNMKYLPRNEQITKESKFYSNTAKNSELFSDIITAAKTNPELRNYIATTHDKDAAIALEQIRTRGGVVITEFFDKETLSSVDTQTAKMLMTYYKAKGEVASELAVYNKVRTEATKSGKFIESLKTFKDLSPAAIVEAIQHDIDRAINELSDSHDPIIRAWLNENAGKANLTQAEREWIYQMANKASKLEYDSTEYRRIYALINSFVADRIPKSISYKVKAFRRMAMLFNPKTMNRNLIGNALMIVPNLVADTSGALADKMLSSKSGLRTMGTVQLGSIAKGVKKGVVDATVDRKLNINTSRTNPFEMQQGKTFNNKWFGGKILNEVERDMNYFLNLGDRPFEEAVYENSIANQLRLNGVTEATETMKEIAHAEAEKKTWKNNGKMLKAASKVRETLNTLHVGELGLGDLVIPFIMTPANLIVATYDYSPMAVITVGNAAVKYKTAMKTGKDVAIAQKAFVDSFGKVVAGTLLYAVAFALAKSGATSGGEDDDKEVAALMRAKGFQPFAIKIGDTSYSYDWAQPIANPFATMAELQRQSVLNKTNPNASDTANQTFKTIADAMTIGGDRLYEQSFLQSVKQLLSADSPQEGIINFSTNIPQSFVPTLFKQFADVTDDNVKSTYDSNNLITSMFDKMLAKTPGLKSLVPTKKDVLGNSVKVQGGHNNIFNVFFNPSNVGSDIAGEVGNEILDVYNHTGEKSVMPQIAIKYMDYDINGDGIKDRITFDTTQQATLQSSMGKIVANSMEQMLNNDVYGNANYDQKATAMISLMQYAKAKAIEETGLVKNYEIKYGNAAQINNYINKGLDVPEAVMYDSLINPIKSLKDANGDTIKGSESGQKAYTIMNMQTSDMYKNTMLRLMSPTAKNPETVDSLSNLGTQQKYIDYYALPRKDAFVINKYSRDDYDKATTYYNMDGAKYTQYTNYMSDIKANVDKNGVAIEGSRKAKMTEYINSLPLNKYQKMYLYNVAGYSIKSYQNDMYAYINNMNVTADEKYTLWQSLGFE